MTELLPRVVNKPYRSAFDGMMNHFAIPILKANTHDDVRTPTVVGREFAVMRGIG